MILESKAAFQVEGCSWRQWLARGYQKCGSVSYIHPHSYVLTTCLDERFRTASSRNRTRKQYHDKKVVSWTGRVERLPIGVMV
jgi:hypothetical protein